MEKSVLHVCVSLCIICKGLWRAKALTSEVYLSESLQVSVHWVASVLVIVSLEVSWATNCKVCNEALQIYTVSKHHSEGQKEFPHQQFIELLTSLHNDLLKELHNSERKNRWQYGWQTSVFIGLCANTGCRKSEVGSERNWTVPSARVTKQMIWLS